MTKLIMKNGVVVKAEATQEAKKNVDNVLSISAHEAHARAITRNIDKVAVVIEGIVLRARVNKDTKQVFLCGERFKTLGSNNPNARALMAASGDFDTLGQPVVQLQHWDKDEKKLVSDYTVKCNDKTASRIYIETNTHTVVIYAQLEKDLRKIYMSSTDAEIKKMKDMYVDMVENMGLTITENDNVYIAKQNVYKGTHLTVLTWSPSNMRGESQLMTSMQPRTAFNILNKVSGGAFDEAFRGMLSVSQLTKASARLGILGAPSVEMVKSANEDFGYVIVLDEILGPQDYNVDTQDMLESNGIYIDDNTSDGANCLSVEYIVASFASLGRKISKEKALLFALQSRANVYFTKVFGEAKTQLNMQYRLNKLIEKYGIDKVLFVEAGADVSKLKKSDYKVIVVGNRDCLGTIIDYNGGKLLKNISLQTIVNGNVTTHLLQIAKCSDTKTAGQMLSKFLIANKDKAIEALLECMATSFDNNLEEMLNGDINADKCSLSQFLLRYVDGGTENSAALESLIKEELPRQKSMVYKSRIEIDAYFQRALFDDTFFLTAGKVDSLLAKNENTNRLECYSRDIEVKFAEQIAAIESNDTLTREQKDAQTDALLTGAAFKYPSPSSDETAILTYVTARRLKDRIDTMHKQGVITESEREILADDFLNTSYGVTKLGADNTIKHKLAGMDTDYDGIAIVFEEKLVDILKTKQKDNDGLATIICK